jgi:hypothetical protein
MDSFDHFRIGIIGYGISKIYATAFRNSNNYYNDLQLSLSPSSPSAARRGSTIGES